MQSMNKLRVGKEHERAKAFDYMYLVFAAELHRLWSDGTRSGASVQPDTVDRGRVGPSDIGGRGVADHPGPVQ